MHVLTGFEELFLLVILKLEDNAYGVTIRREISEVTGKDWSIGAVYDHLYRMEKQGWIASSFSKPVRERGGRSKRMFQVQAEGKRALVSQKKIRDRLWKGVDFPLTGLG